MVDPQLVPLKVILSTGGGSGFGIHRLHMVFMAHQNVPNRTKITTKKGDKPPNFGWGPAFGMRVTFHPNNKVKTSKS